MTPNDIAALGSVVLTVAVLLTAIITKKNTGWFMLIPWGLCVGATFTTAALNDVLTRAMIFGFIAALAQPLWADPYLTARTLVYAKNAGNNIRLRNTPLWMVPTWNLALTQLAYLWMRADAIPYIGSLNRLSQYAMFVVVGFAYFYIFEVLVGNWAPQWWTRRCCRQPFGVAVYASVAELATVAVIPIVMVISTKYDIVGCIIWSVVGGYAIALAFIYCCKKGYTGSAVG